VLLPPPQPMIKLITKTRLNPMMARKIPALVCPAKRQESSKAAEKAEGPQ